MQQQKSASSQTADQDWRDLAERAANEMDPFRLTELVNQLCDKLDGIRSPGASLTRKNTQPDWPTIQ